MNSLDQLRQSLEQRKEKLIEEAKEAEKRALKSFEKSLVGELKKERNIIVSAIQSSRDRVEEELAELEKTSRKAGKRGRLWQCLALVLASILIVIGIEAWVAKDRIVTDPNSGTVWLRIK